MTMPNETKPHHRRAAAEALNPTPDNTTQVAIDHWVACGEWMSRSSLTRFYPTQLRHERTAQAIADAEERGRQELPSPERLNRIQIPLPECEVTGRNLKHLMLTNGGALLYHTLADSESAALAHVLNGTRFRPTLLLEPVPARAALEGKP